MSSSQPPVPLRTLLCLKDAGGAPRIIVWDTEEVSAGRSPENDIVVDDSDVSRRHALFSRGTADHFIEDLGAQNGTLVNGEPVGEQRALKSKDVVRIGECEITFIRTRKDPAASGVQVDYASQLKGFGGPGAPRAAPPDATTLGLMDTLSKSSPDERFHVGAVGDIIDDVTPPAGKTRDLDLDGDLDGDLDFVGGDPTKPTDNAASTPTLSLHLEIDGLTDDLRSLIERLIDKEIALPKLRLRIKSDDLC